jgi:vancomycin resistance protein VanJ
MTSIVPIIPSSPLRFVLKIAWLTFKILVDSYGLSVSGFLVLRFLIGEQWVWIAFFNTFAHLLWIPALFLLPLFLLLRRWLSVALLILPVVAFIFSYGGQFIPRTNTPPRDAQTFTLLSYNLLANGAPPEQRFAVIRSLNADIVALQEISSEMASALQREFAAVYPYMALHPVANQGTAGQGILSRYPILEDEFWRFDWLYIPLGHQRVVLEIGGTPVTLYNLHPTHPGMAASDTFFDPSQRSREIGALLTRIQNEKGAVLLAGDFNMPDLSADYAKVTQHFGDAYRAVGWGMGWTFRSRLPLPLLRLDYVFYNEFFQPISARVGDHGGSDHAALWVELALVGDNGEP